MLPLAALRRAHAALPLRPVRTRLTSLKVGVRALAQFHPRGIAESARHQDGWRFDENERPVLPPPAQAASEHLPEDGLSGAGKGFDGDEERYSGATAAILSLALFGGGMLLSALVQGNKASTKGAAEGEASNGDTLSPEDVVFGPGASVLLPDPPATSAAQEAFKGHWEVSNAQMSEEEKKGLRMAMIGSDAKQLPSLKLLQGGGSPSAGSGLGLPPADQPGDEEPAFTLSKTYFGLLWLNVMGAVAFALPSIKVYQFMLRNFTSGPSVLADPYLSRGQKAKRIVLSVFGANGMQALFGLFMAHCFLEPLILNAEAMSFYAVHPPHLTTSGKELAAVFLGTGVVSSYFTAAIGRALNDLRPPTPRGISPAVFGSFAYLTLKYPETPITFLWTMGPALLWLYAVTFPHVLLSTFSMMKPALARWRFKGNPTIMALAASTINREAIANTTGLATGLLFYWVFHRGLLPAMSFEEGAPRRMAYARGSKPAGPEGEERSGHGQRGQLSAEDVERSAVGEIHGSDSAAKPDDTDVDIATGRRRRVIVERRPVSGGPGQRGTEV